MLNINKTLSVLTAAVMLPSFISVATSAAVPTDLKSGDGIVAKVIDGPTLDNTLVTADPLKSIKNSEFIVKGNMRFDGWFLKADRIIFEPGSSLVFSRTALSNRRQFWIVAKEIVVKDANAPGVISWEKSVTPAPPSAPGEAPAGPNATVDGNAGSPGNTGNSGATGYSGENAPQITLVVTTVPTSGVTVDLTGGNGGQGGQGMKGGRGGSGAGGRVGSQGGFGCLAGAGNGGSGGAGGAGGLGGEGGVGGNGGSFLIVSEAELLPTLTQKFRVRVSSAQGGTAGQGGPGGDGGAGGRGGSENLPYCRGNGNQGPAGPTGPAGAIGAAGQNGQEGDFTVGGVTKEQLQNYIWPSI